MNDFETLAIALLAAGIIITVAVALWILEAPGKVRQWLEKHSR